MCLLDKIFFCQFDNCNCAQCFAGTSHPPKNLDCHFSGVACGISLHWYAELMPDLTEQRDACTALVSSENPAHLRQKMCEIYNVNCYVI